MKTAEIEEVGRIVAKVSICKIDLISAAFLINKQLELIELAGWKRGMTDAAGIANKSVPKIPYLQHLGANKAVQAILSKRDEKGGNDNIYK